MIPVTPHQFALFRIMMGAYLLIHFANLIPYASEMFSNQGLIPNGLWNPTSKIFPNILNLYDSPVFTQTFLVMMTVLSGLLMIGWKRPWVAFLLWYGWACLFNRNIFTANPSLPFIGWLLIAFVFIPSGEPLSKGTEKSHNWFFPKEIFYGAWILLSLGYTFSGIDKLESPSWLNGTALYHILSNPLGRNNYLCKWLVSMPEFLTLLTWGILGLEIFFAPLALFSRFRPWIWLAVVLMHFGALGAIDFADLTFGILMFHFFIFDARWVPARTSIRNQTPILFFDGICGLCNGFIDFLLQEERIPVYKFSPLQGKAAAHYLNETQQTQLDSLIIWRDNTILLKSSATLKCLVDLGGIWGLFRVFYLIPAPVRDGFYDFIASNRYKIFGKRETCRLPTPEEKNRFLE